MSQTKYVIKNLRQFFEKRKGSLFKRERIIECTLRGTSVSVILVRVIHNKYISQKDKLLLNNTQHIGYMLIKTLYLKLRANTILFIAFIYNDNIPL